MAVRLPPLWRRLLRRSLEDRAKLRERTGTLRELQKREPGMQRRSRSLERRKRVAESTAPDPDSPNSQVSARSKEEDPLGRPLEEFVEGQHAYAYWYNLAIECEDDGELEEALEVQ